MDCPNCRRSDTKVLESSPVENTNAVRRRRQCNKCGLRFSTQETIKELKKGKGKGEPSVK